MSNLPISSKYRSLPDELVQDVDRQDLAGRLGEAFTRGDVDTDRYRCLLDLTYRARTLGELLPVAEAVPVKTTHMTPPVVQDVSGQRPGQVNVARSALPMAKVALGGVALLALLVVLLVLAL